MCDVTSCILLVLPESVPVTAQSITPRCSAGVTSPNGIVTGIAPNPAARSDIDLLNTRTFLPLRSAPLSVLLLHNAGEIRPIGVRDLARRRHVGRKAGEIETFEGRAVARHIRDHARREIDHAY